MGDAGILEWAEKYRHDFWRPVIGIREYDTSFGMLNVGQPMAAKEKIDDNADPFWLPLWGPILQFSKHECDDGAEHLPICQCPDRTREELYRTISRISFGTRNIRRSSFSDCSHFLWRWPK